MNETSVPYDFQSELDRVQQYVASLPEGLSVPLGGLVEEQIKAAAPFLRGTIVLAAGVGNPDNADLQGKRIWLAAALEMLYVALHVHKRLLAPAANEVDRSILGSTILAGDYCFSCSAAMAVRTGNPKVVEIFAQALKAVSEGNLRHLFGKTHDSFDENTELFFAGVEAAAVLAQLPTADRENCLGFVGSLAQWLPCLDHSPTPDVDHLPPHQQVRWAFIVHQLLDTSSRGNLSASASPTA